MKNIYLIGDSIRFGSRGGKGSPGYGIYIKQMLNDVANMYAPNENCRFAQYTLREICNWASQVDAEKIDVVHWNNGLWDVMRLHGDEPLTPVDMYINMLERIYRKIRLFFPNAKIIFALSTSVIEKNAPNGYVRYNREIEQYNEAAKNLMESLGVAVNDLYSITQSFDESYYADWVHPNEKGARILADAVIKSIEKEMRNEVR